MLLPLKPGLTAREELEFVLNVCLSDGNQKCWVILQIIFCLVHLQAILLLLFNKMSCQGHRRLERAHVFPLFFLLNRSKPLQDFNKSICCKVIVHIFHLIFYKHEYNKMTNYNRSGFFKRWELLELGHFSFLMKTSQNFRFSHFDLLLSLNIKIE